MFKYVTIYCFVLLAFFACNNNYGTPVDTLKALPISGLDIENLTETQNEITLKGKIGTCCQTQGCWFNFAELPNVTVDFNQAFTIPKNSAGKTAIVNGYFYIDTTINKGQTSFKAKGLILE